MQSADDMSDIESLLADILDEKKPLPTKAKTVVNVIANAGPEALPKAAAAAQSDEDFLAGLMGDDSHTVLPDPLTVAAVADVDGEMAMADAGIAPEGGVTEPLHSGVFSDTSARTGPQTIKMPVFTAEDFAETMDIRNFATLVTLNTARWHAKVKDRQASKDAATAGEADENSFETRKRLLVGADGLLKAIHKTIDEARVTHYRLTLPWSTTAMGDIGRRTGGRLLPNTLFVEYTTEMAKHKANMLAALNAFEPEYPNLIATAKKKLGKRFDVREYPNVSSIRSHFDLSFDFQPIPKGEDFGGLPKVQLDMLAAKVNENTRLQAEHAMQDVWIRVHDAVGRMAERLADPEKMFHNTLVQNVRDVAHLLAHLNVTGDSKVELIRQKIEKHLCQYECKDLREKATIRAQVAAHAASIIEEMNA